jgi:multisubunit Na+/H+ antiporter MnhB subunit
VNAFAILLFTPLAIAWKGLVLSILWGWFLVPLGAPALTVSLACGVALIATFLTTDKLRERPPREAFDVLAVVVLWPAVSLLIGWCIKQFT